MSELGYPPPLPSWLCQGGGRPAVMLGCVGARVAALPVQAEGWWRLALPVGAELNRLRTLNMEFSDEAVLGLVASRGGWGRRRCLPVLALRGPGCELWGSAWCVPEAGSSIARISSGGAVWLVH